MAATTERISVLVSRTEKERISNAARASGLSMGEYLRRAARAFHPEKNDEALEGLLDQVRKSTAGASCALDHALTEVAASMARIETMESVAVVTEGPCD